MTPIEEEKIEAYANCKAQLEVFANISIIGVWIRGKNPELALEFNTRFLTPAFEESNKADKEYKKFLNQ